MCIYCNSQDHSDLIHETSHWKIILSPEQSYLGRCMVVLKRHISNYKELTAEEIKDFNEVVINKLEKSIKRAFNASHFDWKCVIDDNMNSIPSNAHIHWHIKPRYKKPANLDGYEVYDPESKKGKYLSGKLPEFVRIYLARKIRSNF